MQILAEYAKALRWTSLMGAPLEAEPPISANGWPNYWRNLLSWLPMPKDSLAESLIPDRALWRV